MSYILHNAHWFILLVGALVIFHELGHFLFAKAFDVKVLRFSVGMGPRLLSVQVGETEYQLSLLPIGGYVKMLGETSDDDPEAVDAAEQAELSEEERGRSFAAKPLYQRVAIILAGPFFNFLLAGVVYLLMFQGSHTVGDTRLGIVTPGGPAAQAGLLPGDRVRSINGRPVYTWDSLRDAIAAGSEAPIQLEVERLNGPHRLTIQPDSGDDGPRASAHPRRVGISLQYIAPVVALPDGQSPAARAGLQDGDEILEVNGVAVVAWHEVRLQVAALSPRLPIELRVRRAGVSSPVNFSFVAEPGYPAGIDPQLLSAADPAGAYSGLVAREVEVAQVDADSPAAAAGLQAGDRLLAVQVHAVDGPLAPQAIHVWSIDLAGLQADPHDMLTLVWQRGRQVARADLHLAERHQVDEMKEETSSFVLGALHDTTLARMYTTELNTSWAGALARAGQQVADDTTLVVRALGKLVRGDIPFKQVGGPIMLFVIAEKSAKRGAEFFLRTLAMISVNIGLMNLLPVPSLDGGHLVFLGLEGISRRKPSLRVRELANVVGLVLLIILMAMVFRNDVMRFVF